MAGTVVLDEVTVSCPVCGGHQSLSITRHRHGVKTPAGADLVTVVSYTCRLSDCSVPTEELLLAEPDHRAG